MFDRFKQNVGQAAAIAKWKGDQLVRINKVQGEISNLKRELANTHEQIAKAVLDMRQRGETLPPELEAACANIDALQAQVTEHEAQLATINAEQAPSAQPVPAAAPVPTPAPAAPAGAMKTCPSCHNSVPFAAGFCPNCGFKFAPAEAEKTTVTCPNCAFEVPAGSAFCPNCGTRVVG